ncbi:MAG: DnaD domain protein [Clostridia bacterium]|nr:DnaD domain protein [Clostridia bacterium]
MKLNIKKGEETLCVPKSCLSVLLDADACDLRVLLYAAGAESGGEELDTKKAADDLQVSEGEVKSSLKFWFGAGVLKKKAQKKAAVKEETAEEPKKATRARRALPEKRTATFTANELCEIAEVNEEFKVLLDAAQQTAGWIFNTSEIEIIASLYSNLMLPGEYILALIGYYVCRREKPLRYLERVAYTLIDEGIDTPDALEEKLRWLEKFEGRAGKVRTLFGLGGRNFTKKEEAFLADWFDVYNVSDEMLKEAYEITVNNTGKASLSYANSILKSWHEDGIKTPLDIKKKDAPRASPPKTTRSGTATARSFNVDDALTKALERSYNGDKK